jgi:hypothetical protein
MRANEILREHWLDYFSRDKNGKFYVWNQKKTEKWGPYDTSEEALEQQRNLQLRGVWSR